MMSCEEATSSDSPTSSKTGEKNMCSSCKQKPREQHKFTQSGRASASGCTSSVTFFFLICAGGHSFLGEAGLHPGGGLQPVTTAGERTGIPPSLFEEKTVGCSVFISEESILGIYQCALPSLCYQHQHGSLYSLQSSTNAPFPHRTDAPQRRPC